MTAKFVIRDIYVNELPNFISDALQTLSLYMYLYDFHWGPAAEGLSDPSVDDLNAIMKCDCKSHGIVKCDPLW